MIGTTAALGDVAVPNWSLAGMAELLSGTARPSPDALPGQVGEPSQAAFCGQSLPQAERPGPTAINVEASAKPLSP